VNTTHITNPASLNALGRPSTSNPGGAGLPAYAAADRDIAQVLARTDHP
jgi:hypothetical protein